MNQRAGRTMCLSVLIHRFAISLAITVIAACAQAPGRQHSPTVDDVIAGVQDPQMKAVWKEASDRGELPPVAAIPTPDQPVTHRVTSKVVTEVADSAPVRPVIPGDAVISVQAFSESALSQYDGPFEVRTHEPGIIKGILSDRGQPFEIHYRLPKTEKALLAQRPAALNLMFRELVVDNSLQQRIILHEIESSRLALAAIAEGDREPVNLVVDKLGLVIRQSGDGENPPVTVSYANDSVTLQQGESKSLGQLTVYLLNSYAQDKRFAFSDAGQPYFVNLIVYR